jgi:predicted lactoylglutathione lyase
MNLRVSVVTLGVEDLARSRRFYEEGLRAPVRESASGVVYLELSGVRVALYPRPPLAEYLGLDPELTISQGTVLSWNLASREEVAAVLSRAGIAGARILRPPREMDWGGFAGSFLDPDGHVWEVVFNPGVEVEALD